MEISNEKIYELLCKFLARQDILEEKLKDIEIELKAIKTIFTKHMEVAR